MPASAVSPSVVFQHAVRPLSSSSSSSLSGRMPKMQRQPGHSPRPEGSSTGASAANASSSVGPVGVQQLSIRGAGGSQVDPPLHQQQQYEQRPPRNRGGGDRGRGPANGGRLVRGGPASGLSGFHRMQQQQQQQPSSSHLSLQFGPPPPRPPANGPRAQLFTASGFGPSSSGFQGGGGRMHHQQQPRTNIPYNRPPAGAGGGGGSSQAFIPRPGSYQPPPVAPTSTTASTSTSAPGPHAAGAARQTHQPHLSSGPSSSAHAHVRPMSAKAKKADPFAHLPVYDYLSHPSRTERPTLLLMSDPTLIDEAVAHLGSPVGLDIEWAPTFQAGAPVKPTSLLQISDGQTIVVIQTLSLLGRCPPGLRAFLEDETIIKLGVGILPDGTKLSRDLGVDCKGFYDLNSLRPPDAQSPKMAKGLAALTGLYTGYRLHKSKNVTMSNWALAKLSPSQIAYAANDVQSAVDIYAALRAEAKASSFALKGPPGWSWSARGAIPSVGKRVSDDLVRRVAAAPGAVDYSSSGFYPPGFERGEQAPKAKKPDPNTWWAQAVDLFRDGRSLVEIGVACKPPTQQARSSMDVRFGIANYLSRRSESLTAEQGKTLLAGLTLDTKGRIPLTLMVEELVRRG